MTQSGEQLTEKGEFYEFALHPRERISVSFLKNFQGQNTLIQPSDKEDSPHFKMIFVLRGQLYCKYSERDTVFTVISNQHHNLIAMPQNVHVSVIPGNEQTEIICINLSASFISRYLPAAHPAFKNLLNTNQVKPVIFSGHHLHLTPEISSILSSIENSSHTGFCRTLFLESKVIELLALQISQFELMIANQLSGNLKKEDLDKMNEAREILINHASGQLSLRSLAHMVGTNEFNLKKNFKAAFGNTVFGYLNEYKMEQAKTMLIAGDSNVSEVSGKMGYKHATHFTSAFKKYFGYLPTKIKMMWLLFDPEFYLILFSI